MSDNISEAMGIVTGIVLLVIALSITTYLFTIFNNHAIRTYENQLNVKSGSLVDASDFNPGITTDKGTEDDEIKKIVGIDKKIVNKNEVISMIERYSKENFSVKIYDDDSNLKQVFDLNLERNVRNIAGSSSLSGYDQKIRETFANSSSALFMFNAPWLASGDDLARNREAFIRERIDLFQRAAKGYINDQYVDYSTPNRDWFNGLDKKTTFTEYIIKYQYAGDVRTDTLGTGDFTEQIVTGNAPTYKVEVIYIQNKK